MPEAWLGLTPISKEEIISGGIKYEFEIPNSLAERRLVLCRADDPTPFAYFNVYDLGDIWFKVKGCESCSIENRMLCCGDCPLSTEKGCLYHLRGRGRAATDKPYHCVVDPPPDRHWSFCSLEFLCVAGGKHEGQIRKLCEPRDVFHG